MSTIQTDSRRTDRTAAPEQLNSLVGRMAAEYGVDKDKFYKTLANSVFAQTIRDRNGVMQPKAPTPEEMLALLVICDRFKLDPFMREIYAFSNRGRIVPIVSIDGWLSIINRQPDYDGLSVEDSPNLVKIGTVSVPEFCRVSIYRKSLSRPIVISEYASEAFVPASEVWKKYPRRMLRHKAIIQAARVAFSISGIYDRDDAMSIVSGESEVIDVASHEIRTNGPQTAQRVERPRRSIAFKSREEIDGALESAIKSALMRKNWSVAEQWVNASLEGTQREYGLAYLEDRRRQLLEKEQATGDESQPQSEEPAGPSQTAQAVPDEEPPMPPAANFEDLPY